MVTGTRGASGSRVRRVLLATACVFGVATPLHADPATDVDPQRVLAGIEAALNYLATSSDNHLKLQIGPNATAKSYAGGVRVTFPDVKMLALDDGVTVATLALGTITVDQQTVEGGRWRLSGTLPKRVAVELTGEPIPVASIGSSTYSMVVDPMDAFFFAMDLTVNDIRVGVDDTVRIGQAHMVTDVQITDTGEWMAPGRMTFSHINMVTDDGSTVAIGEWQMAGTAEGADFPRLRRVSKLLQAMSPGDVISVMSYGFQALTAFFRPSMLMIGLEGSTTMSGVRMTAPDGGRVLALGSALVEVSVKGLDGDTGRLGATYRHDDLTVAETLAADRPMPEAVDIGIYLENLPVAGLTNVMLRLVGLGSGGSIDDSDLEDRILALMTQAGVALHLESVRIEGPTAGVAATGRVAASAQSPLDLVGELALDVRNFEALMVSFEDALDEDDRMALTAIALLGQQETLPDGTLMRRYRAEVQDDGRIWLNGTDVTALIDYLELRGDDDDDWGGRDLASDHETIAAGLSAAGIAEILRSQGLLVSVTDDGRGSDKVLISNDPTLPAAALHVNLFGCGDNGACRDALVWSWFTPTGKPGLLPVNAWNAESRWTRTYIDSDGDVRLEMDIRDLGGVSKPELAWLMETYLGQLDDITAYFGTAQK